MAVGFYMDHHIPRAITSGLRRKGVEVITAEEDGAKRFHDSDLLARATELKKVLFTFDDDLLTEAALCQRNNKKFAGLVYAHCQDISIGKCIRDLEIIAKAGESEDLEHFVIYLPL